MKRAFVLACLMAILATSSGLAAGAEPVTTTTVFRDSTGEDPAGPDITTVRVVGNDTELTFRIAVPTNPTFTPGMRLILWLDADDDLNTGLTGVNLDGWDHVMYVDPISYGDDTPHLLSCVGGVNICGIPESRPEYSYSSGATVTLSRNSLGLSRIERVRFRVSVATGIRLDPATGFDFTNAHFDLAPDEGDWTFDARPLSVADFRPTPTGPRAGKPFALTMRVVRADTGATLVSGKVACSLRVGGERVAVRASRFVGQRATCAFEVPAGTMGQRFRATIAVAARGSGVTRSLSGRVR